MRRWFGVWMSANGGSVSLGRRDSLSDSTVRPALTCAPSSAALPDCRAPNLINEMADAMRAGPLLLLRRLREERAAVRVFTRHEHGLCGVATGTLVAFDKHLNLVLLDVEESYTVLVFLWLTDSLVQLRERSHLLAVLYSWQCYTKKVRGFCAVGYDSWQWGTWTGSEPRGWGAWRWGA